MIRTAFAQENQKEAHRQWRENAETLRRRFHKLAELMDEAEEDVLAFMAYPRDHWPQLASTNPLERLMKEIKRRSNVVGIFPNEAAIKRLVGAILLEHSEEWMLNRRYLQLEALQSLSDTATPRLSAVQR